MKKLTNIFIIASLAITFLGSNLFAQEIQKDPNELKILSYNLRFGELASLQELADFINQENPDVVALQEVDILTHRERAVHQNGRNFISELAYYTKMLSAFGKTINYRGGYYGIGVLSKYPIIKSERILLLYPPGSREQRAYLVTTIELPNGKHINFVSTHLEYTNNQGVREIQVEALNKDLLNRDIPTIICGDFNATPNAKEIKEGMEAWKHVSTDDFTILDNNPTSKIDYIFCYPQSSWEFIRAETPDVRLSDHLPITATIKLVSEK